jgi:EAL domain-containing protein (putative c-di-GMP-specific phosphodiesterase class I)
VDDFCTGYSSLTYIRRFPVDVLKIDRSFIDGVAGGSAETEALTASILQLAEILSLKPVAEGIEDAAQLERLRELGCPLGQGYHLHRPLGADAVAELVRAQGSRDAAVAA